MDDKTSLLPEIGPDGLPRESPVIAYTEKVSSSNSMFNVKFWMILSFVPVCDRWSRKSSLSWRSTFSVHTVYYLQFRLFSLQLRFFMVRSLDVFFHERYFWFNSADSILSLMRTVSVSTHYNYLINSNLWVKVLDKHIST